MIKQNILFVCSRNKRRSLTAETIFEKSDIVNAKSCGTSPVSRVKINEKLIRWANEIWVMEKRHREIINQRYSEILKGKVILVLNIPDEFSYMDETLIEILEEKCLSQTDEFFVEITHN